MGAILGGRSKPSQSRGAYMRNCAKPSRCLRSLTSWDTPMTDYAIARIEDVEELSDGRCPWRPIRHHFGITSFGVNSWTAREAGERMINEHDESEPDSGAQRLRSSIWGARSRSPSNLARTRARTLTSTRSAASPRFRSSSRPQAGPSPSSRLLLRHRPVEQCEQLGEVPLGSGLVVSSGIGHRVAVRRTLVEL
jgi:hypothetical protein